MQNDLPNLVPGIPQDAADISWTAIVIMAAVSVGLVLFIIYHKKGIILKGMRQTWQRLKAPMPTFFKRFAFLFGSLAASGQLGVYLERIKAMDFPEWVKPEWVENFSFFAGGIIAVAAFTVNWSKAEPGKIPDIKHPAKPDALISVAPDGRMEVEVLNPNQI